MAGSGGQAIFRGASQLAQLVSDSGSSSSVKFFGLAGDTVMRVAGSVRLGGAMDLESCKVERRIHPFAVD